MLLLAGRGVEAQLLLIAVISNNLLIASQCLEVMERQSQDGTQVSWLQGTCLCSSIMLQILKESNTATHDDLG